VLAFFWYARVINDQGLDRTALLDDGQDTGAHRGEHCVVGPIGFRHEVVQRLVGGPHPPGLNACGHRLDAFAIARQQQSCTIRLERRDAIGMAKNRRNRLDISSKP
jgi:hypothetical protein